ncbi:MAG TPA: glycosyl hydrolase [Solirubrobacteraceae bacterium]|nr:glycosyl hydrolase [Solirubrobacteraceae bacterium]
MWLSCACRRLVLVLLAASCLGPLAAGAGARAAAPGGSVARRAVHIDDAKSACVYSDESIAELDAFSALVGHRMRCAMVYNDAVSSWAQWEHPWFVNYVNAPDHDWSRWVAAAPRLRRLIITEDLFPSSLAHSDWLGRGAAGAFTAHARTLARVLVAAGLGDSVIRLAPEANGTWFADSYGATRARWRLWDRFWDRTVAAMRGVPGARFRFDWCISVRYRDLPLSEIYPGDRYVDIIGMDVYDDGPLGATGVERWRTLMTAPDGIGAVLTLAHREHRPISIPEWGVNTVAGGGFGDDPAFVRGIAALVRDHPTAYQSYFYRYGQRTQLAPGTRSLAAYRAWLGGRPHAGRRGR